MRQWAEEEGALPLSSLTGTDIMTEPRFLPAALAADFMPLGDLYETELANLFPGFISPAPEAAMRDGFLIRLHRKHESATELANRFPESEREIRRLQRQAPASCCAPSPERRKRLISIGWQTDAEPSFSSRGIHCACS